jgi:hypothetical protein
MRLAPIASCATLALCLSLAGCADRMEEAAVAAASGGKVEMDKDGDTTTVKTDEGSFTLSNGGDQPLPADFPSDAFLPAEYKVQTVAEAGGATMLQLAVPGEVAATAQAVADGMKAQSWKTQMTAQQNGTHVLMFEKDGRTIAYNVMGNPDGKGAYVGVQIVPKQP